MLKPFLRVLIASTWIATPTATLAADWLKVTENSVRDQFFVDKTSILRQGDTVRYWEYREFQQPNNAFLEEAVPQPVYGVVMNWSVDCVSKAQRLRQLTAYNQKRQVIRKFSYGDTGSLAQPRSGSSAGLVVDFVCASGETPESTEGK